MRDLEAGAVVKAQLAQRRPIALGHPGRFGAELFGHRAQGASARRQIFQFAPSLALDCVDQFGVATLDTQKLCV
jgi:hypothetical protein